MGFLGSAFSLSGLLRLIKLARNLFDEFGFRSEVVGFDVAGQEVFEVRGGFDVLAAFICRHLSFGENFCFVPRTGQA